MNDYGYLLEPFLDFVDTADDQQQYEWDVAQQPFDMVLSRESSQFNESVLRAFGLEAGESRTLQKHMNGWKQLGRAEIQAMLNYLNSFMVPIKGLAIKVEPLSHDKAIEWLWIDVDSLQLPGLRLFLPASDWSPTTGLKSLDELPYRQCYWCGNRGIQKTSQKRCHHHDCDTSITAPAEHPVGCCMGEWNRLKINFKKQLQRASTPQAIKALFDSFLKQRYQANLRKQDAVYPKAMDNLVNSFAAAFTPI